jgi:Amt family ammonium transporter
VIQLISVGVGYAVAIIGTVVVISILKKLTKVRVEPQEEINGLDLVLHGERVSE